AAVLAVVLAGWAVARRRDLVGRIGALAAGLVAGVLPWLVEMTVRFGSPATALREAASTGHVGGSSPGGTLVQYLYLSDGPTIGPDRSASVPVLGALWWAGLVALVIAAL